MADVEMSDAPSASKKVDVANGKGSEGKKKFEVKKVRFCIIMCATIPHCHVKTWIVLTTFFVSGMLSHSGLGILLLTTVPSAATTSWIYVCPS